MSGALVHGVRLHGSTSRCQHTSITSAVTRHSKFESLPPRSAAGRANWTSDFAVRTSTIQEEGFRSLESPTHFWFLQRAVEVLNHGGLRPTDSVWIMRSLWPLPSSTGQISPQIFIEESRATAGFQLSVNTVL